MTKVPLGRRGDIGEKEFVLSLDYEIMLSLHCCVLDFT